MEKLKNIINKIPLLLWKGVKFILSWGAIFLSVILGLILVVVLYFFISCQYAHFEYNKFRQIKPFDSITWKEANLYDANEAYNNFNRCYMYKDLIKHKLHFGMQYEEVIRLLGEPIYIMYYVNPEIKTIEYDIGYCTLVCLSEATDVRGYNIQLEFDRSLKLIGYGHEDDWHQKRGFSLKDRKNLFYCNSEDMCRRYINKGSYKKGIIMKRENNDLTDECNGEVCTRYKREKCKKDEVEAKWGYKVW